MSKRVGYDVNDEDAFVGSIEHVRRFILDAAVDSYAERLVGMAAPQDDLLQAGRLRIVRDLEHDYVGVALEFFDAFVVRELRDVAAIHAHQAVADAESAGARGRSVGHDLRDEYARLVYTERMTSHVAAAHYTQAHGAVLLQQFDLFDRVWRW